MLFGGVAVVVCTFQYGGRYFIISSNFLKFSQDVNVSMLVSGGEELVTSASWLSGIS